MRNKKPCGRLTTVVVIPTRLTKIIPNENFPNEKHSMSYGKVSHRMASAVKLKFWSSSDSVRKIQHVTEKCHTSLHYVLGVETGAKRKGSGSTGPTSNRRLKHVVKFAAIMTN